MQKIALFIAIFLSYSSFANEHTVSVGSIISVPVPQETTEAIYLEKKVSLYMDQGKQYALIGIGLKYRPGIYNLTAHNQDTLIASIPVTIIKKDYKISRFNITKSKFASPSKQDLEIAVKESKNIRTIIKQWSDLAMELPIIMPAMGITSGRFGTKRIINDIPRNPHRGLDIANKTGTPIVAPTRGTVVLVGNLFYTGNTVMISHGQSLYSLYAHLEKIDVEEQQVLDRGDTIGKMGNTGRVTGPHLHLGMYLNGNAVDPESLIDNINH